MSLTNKDVLDRFKELKSDSNSRFDKLEKKIDDYFSNLTFEIHESQKHQALIEQNIKTHESYILELKDLNNKNSDLLKTVSAENDALRKQNKSIFKYSKWIIGLLIPAVVGAYYPVRELVSPTTKNTSSKIIESETN